jgi:hypothetical protein
MQVNNAILMLQVCSKRISAWSFLKTKRTQSDTDFTNVSARTACKFGHYVSRLCFCYGSSE